MCEPNNRVIKQRLSRSPITETMTNVSVTINDELAIVDKDTRQIKLKSLLADKVEVHLKPANWTRVSANNEEWILELAPNGNQRIATETPR